MAEISGQIIAVLPTRSGTSARGTEWSSQTAVVETKEQYPKKVAFDVMGDKIAQFNLQVGDYVTVSYDVEAREYNGKWWNSVRAWNVVRANQQQQAYQQPPQQQQQSANQQQQAYQQPPQQQQQQQSLYQQPQQPPVNNGWQPPVNAQQQAPFPPQQQAAQQGNSDLPF